MSDYNVPGTGGPPPQPPPQPQPRKKRHSCLFALLGAGGLLVLIVVIAVIAAIAGGGSGPSTGTASAPSSGSSGSSGSAGVHLAGIGNPVRDGKFQFVITKVSHRSSVGDTSLGIGTTAQGRFTELHLTITNIGNQSQTLDDSSQYVFDAAGRKFTANSEADIEANAGNGGGAFLNDINPGNTVRALILFDLPKGDKAVKAELHDSAFSGGVTVRLAH